MALHLSGLINLDARTMDANDADNVAWNTVVTVSCWLVARVSFLACQALKTNYQQWRARETSFA